jgi:hypothetical protein
MKQKQKLSLNKSTVSQLVQPAVQGGVLPQAGNRSFGSTLPTNTATCDTGSYGCYTGTCSAWVPCE